jgi:protein ImuB
LLPSAHSGARPGDEAPFATVIATGGRQLLAAVNPVAAAKGLAPGLPLADALSFLPGLATRPAELAEDADGLRRLAEWCGRYSPWAAPDENNGVKIDITGSAHLWGGEAALVADLSRRLVRQGIVHRPAIADTLGAAWAAARFAPAEDAPTIVLSDGTRDALAPLPIAALRLDPTLVQGLHRVGLRRVGDIMAMPRDALARRFGETVARRLDQALGDTPEPLSPLGEVPIRRIRLSFAEPIADPADLARAAERLTQDLVARLAREGMGARRLDLGFHRVDGRVEHIRIGTARPSRDPAHLAKLLIDKLETVDPGLGVEDAILAAFAVEPLAPEQLESPALRSGAPPPPQSPGQARGGEGWGGGLAPLFDRIGAKLGLDALACLEAHASHIPERASVAIPIEAGCRPPPHPSPVSTGLGEPRSGWVGAGIGASTSGDRAPMRQFEPR